MASPLGRIWRKVLKRNPLFHTAMEIANRRKHEKALISFSELLKATEENKNHTDMKTKLLKRLRRKAKRMIRPDVLNGKLCIRNQYGTYLCHAGYSYDWGIWDVVDFTHDKEEMEKMINAMRRSYILQEVRNIQHKRYINNN